MILVVDFTSSLEVDEIAFFQYILHIITPAAIGIAH